MAQKLHLENQVIPKNKTVVFKSDKPQIVFLKIWNLLEKENIFTINGEDVKLVDCGGKTLDAHHVRTIELDVDQEIELSAEKEKTFLYNMIL